MVQQAIRVTVGQDLKRSIQDAIDRLGGFGRFIQPGQAVLIKPNFNTADPYPASSDWGFLAAFCDLCHENGAAEVAVGDSSTLSLKTAKVMAQWGIDRLVESRPWLTVIDFDREAWVEKPVPGGRFLKRVSVPAALARYDRLFLLPCLKTHKYAAYTGALKLAVGLMRPQERMALHLKNIQEKIAELNAVFKPDLVLMDARKCFIDKGPCNGPVREPILILASTSRVAVDLAGVDVIRGYPESSLAGIEPHDLPQIKRALEMRIDE